MKPILVVLLASLIGMLAGMMPLRPGFRAVARELMRERICAKEGIDESSVVLIADSLIGAHDWEKQGQEFRLDSRLYDIIGCCEIGRHKYYRCITDEAEQSAEAAADEAVSALISPQPRTPRGRLARAIADWLTGLFIASSLQLNRYRAFLHQSAFGMPPAAGWQAPFLGSVQHPPEFA